MKSYGIDVVIQVIKGLARSNRKSEMSLPNEYIVQDQASLTRRAERQEV
jgi:hypothetical protein